MASRRRISSSGRLVREAEVSSAPLGRCLHWSIVVVVVVDDVFDCDRSVGGVLDTRRGILFS